MARIRSIKPEFWVSEQIAECSMSARLTFVGLWNFCDDAGVHPAKPKTLKAELYPMDDTTANDVAAWISELERVGLVAEFTGSDGEKYWHVTGWAKHQKIDRPSVKYPPPPSPTSATPRRTIVEDSPSNDQRVLVEASSKARRAPPPGVERSGEDRNGGGDSPKARRRARAPQTPMPEDFRISDRLRAWAAKIGFDRLDEHFEAFKLKAAAKGYLNADWDAAFMGAVRDDWAGLRSGNKGRGIASASTAGHVGPPPWLAATGFADVFAAENAGCGPGNAHQFRNGERVAA